MTQHAIEIEGLPYGWRAVAYRCPESGEYYLENNGIVIKHTGCKQKFPWIIVEKIQPRRIVLEETEEERSVSYGDWYEDEKGFVRHWSNPDYGGLVCFKIWKEVKE